MRLFNRTAPGLPLNSNTQITVGNQVVEFHPSLYTTRGATFGTSLMFATLIKDLEGVYHLHGCPIDSHQIAGQDALVYLNLRGGEHTVVESIGRAKLHLGNIVQCSRFYGGELPHESRWEEFHALAVLPVGSKLKLKSVRQVAARYDGFKAWALRRQTPAHSVEVITSIAFDGKGVTFENDDGSDT